MSDHTNWTAADFALAQEKFEKVKKQVCVCGSGVELKQSTFGLGVFATKKFLKGDAITLYGGQLISIEEAKQRLKDKKDSHIRRHIVRRFCYDGTYMPNGSEISKPLEQLVGLPIGAFCNDSSDEKQINARFNFIDSAENEKRFASFERGFDYNPSAVERLTFVEAIRDIAEGDEILCSYGHQYWERSAEKKRAIQEQEEAKKKRAVVAQPKKKVVKKTTTIALEPKTNETI